MLYQDLSTIAISSRVNCYALININQSQELRDVKKSTPPTVSRLPITKARINLGQLAKRAHVNGEYFILEKDGIPVVGIMDADELEDYLELRDPKIKAQIRQSNLDVGAGRTRPAGRLLQELKATPTLPRAK
jgi:hypothetical protein